MKSRASEGMQRTHFSLTATKSFLILLCVLYFILPSFLSRYLFDDTFYIYLTQYQPLGDFLSTSFGIFVIAWLLFVVPRRVSRQNPFISRLSKLRILAGSYYCVIIYLVILIAYGMKLKAAGTQRLDLLAAEGDFLLPGMGFLLVTSAVYLIRARSALLLAVFVLLCVIADAVYAGKIFTFVAVGLIFFRLDYADVPIRRMKRIFLATSLLGFAAIVILGVVRTHLAGEEVKSGILPSTYLAASEFMGVQATVGWAIAYNLSNFPVDLLTFDSTLQNSYIGSVGHGLALSPVAYFVGNFGTLSIPVILLTFSLFAWIFRVGSKHLTWVMFLILILNFQHFLRHGVNIFAEKVITQAAYFYLLDRIVVVLVLISNAPRLNAESRGDTIA